jgi:hypothetical protein
MQRENNMNNMEKLFSTLNFDLGERITFRQSLSNLYINTYIKTIINF